MSLTHGRSSGLEMGELFPRDNSRLGDCSGSSSPAPCTAPQKAREAALVPPGLLHKAEGGSGADSRGCQGRHSPRLTGRMRDLPHDNQGHYRS